MKIFFYALICFLSISIQSYATSYNYSILRHHNGLLAQGTNTTQPVYPGIRTPYYFSNSYGDNNFYSQYEMVIAFTLLINNGSYGYISLA